MTSFSAAPLLIVYFHSLNGDVLKMDVGKNNGGLQYGPYSSKIVKQKWKNGTQPNIWFRFGIGKESKLIKSKRVQIERNSCT